MKLGLSIILGLTMTAMIAACGDSKSGGAAPAATPPADPGTVTPNANAPIDASAELSIKNRDQYKKFLKDNNVCDNWYYSWSGNSFTCSYHADFSRLRIVSTSSTFASDGRVSGYAEVGVFEGRRHFIGAITIGNQIYSTNNDTGFEIRTTGGFNSPAHNDWISIRADNARLTSSQVLLKLYYQNVEVGEATVRLH